MPLKNFTEADTIPDAILLYAQKGWGKTTFAAFAPKPIILMSANETGWLTLRRNKMVPDAPYAIIKTEEELACQLQELIVRGVGDRETLVIDALGGIEAMYWEMICRTKYGNDFSKFMSYYAGPVAASAELAKLTAKLDEIRNKLKLRVILLAHDRVDEAPNPMGVAFKQYAIDAYDKTAKAMLRWADMVLFGRHAIRVAKLEGENVGVGDGDRELYCTFQDAVQAGNRHGLPAKILMPKKPDQMWTEFAKRLAAAVNAPVISTPDAPPSAPQSDPLLTELRALISEHKMDDLVPKWLAHFKVPKLDDLKKPDLEAIIAKIKKAKAETSKSA